jgi:hypothetical protein
MNIKSTNIILLPFITNLWLFSYNCYAEEIKLQRLFFSIEQRAKLDREKLSISQRKNYVKSEKLQTLKKIHLNGFIKRGEQPLAVWVNGSKVSHQVGFDTHINEIDELCVPIFIVNGEKIKSFKPGQGINLTEKNSFDKIKISTLKIKDSLITKCENSSTNAIIKNPQNKK